MNENFLIPDQSSLYNIKAIYNTFIDKLGEAGFENLIINPTFSSDDIFLDLSSGVTRTDIGWESNAGPYSHKTMLPGRFFKQALHTLKPKEVYTVVLDITHNFELLLNIKSTLNDRCQIQDLSDINHPINNLSKTITPVLDEFEAPVRHQVSFTFRTLTYHGNDHIPSFIECLANSSGTIDIHNICIVRGALGLNLSKQESTFTDYVKWNEVKNCYELSSDAGQTYHRILTTRPEDIDKIVDVLTNNNIIYTKTQCDLQFLRKDIPDVANRLITFLDGIRSDGGDINIAEADKLILDGGSIVVNNIQQVGTPNKFFSLMVKRGDERDVGIRYNESIDRWQFTHDGIDWKILGSGEGGSGGTGSSELEYYAEILDKTPYAFGYYDLFDEVDQGDSVNNFHLNYNGQETLYEVEDHPTGPWFITSKNIWNPVHVGTSYSFFVHVLTNEVDNTGINVAYSLVGSGGGDPLVYSDPNWIPISANDTITPNVPINELYLRFELNSSSVKFHSFGIFYGTWAYSYATYTRLREYFTASSTSQTITVPNGGSYTVGTKALELYVNRVRQILDVDYTEVDKHTVQMLVPVNSGDLIEFYEKFGFADFSEDNSITIDAHIANTSIHCDCPNLTSRISTVETWQTNFSELDATALAALSSHVTDTVDAHNASAISNVPSGSISSTTVQNAINELEVEINAKADSGHNHNTTYLGLTTKAADSDLLDGHDSSYFLPASSPAVEATKLATARIISIHGAVKSSIASPVYFDGTANIVIDTTLDASLDDLSDCRTPSANVAMGYQAYIGFMGTAPTGNYNTACGRQSLSSASTGNRNTGLGYQSLYTIGTGDHNTGIGYQSLMNNTTGDNNIGLGSASGTSFSPSGKISSQSNIICLGNNDTTTLYCADTTISSSDERDKADITNFEVGLAFIDQLRPVTYRWDRRTWYGTEEEPFGIPDGSKKRDNLRVGLLAQELETVEESYGIKNLISNHNEDDTSMGIDYVTLVPALINAIQELSNKVNSLEEDLNSLN